MNARQNEMEELEKGWKKILIIWFSMPATLGIYIIICNIAEEQLQFGLDPELPVETIKNALYAVSIATIICVHYLRSYMLNNIRPAPDLTHASELQHPAVGRYLTIIIIVSALLESIGIYGLLLFLFSNNFTILYQFIAVSAAGMIYFRPRKEELIYVADSMR